MRRTAVLGLLLLSWIIAAGALHFSGLQHTEVLTPSNVRHEAGCSYLASLARPFGFPITGHRSDSASAPTASKLVLYEDGVRVGRPHSLHDDIRNQGAGRYSYWRDTLYFSSSDCSDPRSNGRTYTITTSIGLSTSSIVALLMAVAGLVFVIRASAAEHPRLQSLLHSANTIWGVLVYPTNRSQQRCIHRLLFIVLILSSVAFLLWKWTVDVSQSILPAAGSASNPSDGMGYWVCANALLDMGRFGSDLSSVGSWCQRRSAYPSFLATTVLLGGQTLFGALLVQLCIVAMSFFLLFRTIARHIGILSAAVCVALLYMYATVHMFAFTLTENAGLLFGCAGFALLLVASHRRSWSAMAIGIAMVSIALNARAGAFLVLPCLILWAGITARHFGQKVWLWIVVAAAACFTGFAAQAFIVLSVGGDPTSSHGNFSYVLYGLTAGGKGWQQVLVDHPAIVTGLDANISKAIYSLAWENFKANPGFFFGALANNLRTYFSSGAYGFTILGHIGIAAQALWWLAWIPIAMRHRDPAYSLIGLSSLGVMMSSPFLIEDGGPRIFAATIPVDVIQIGFGLFWLGAALTACITDQRLKDSCSHFSNKTYHSRLHVLGMGFCAALLAMLLIPHTPIRQLAADALHASTRCPEGEHTVLTNIGTKGTLLLDITIDRDANFFQGKISAKRLLRDIPDADTPSARAVIAGGVTLLAAQQLDLTDIRAPGPYWVYSRDDLSEYYGTNARLCIESKESFALLGNSFRLIKSIHPYKHD